jgi:WD40 repeat protein
MSVPSFHSLRSITDDGDSTDSYQNMKTAIESVRHDSPRTAYSKLRNAREQATFNLMMRMDPSALAKIRQEFYSRNDEVSLTDFIYIMYRHLIELAEPDSVISQKHQDTRSFVSDMNELFKEVDVNGDGMMEWEEFTKFTVEKASLLNQKFVMATIPEYVESTGSLDNSIRTFRRHDICRMLPMPSIGCFSVLEEHSKDISIYYSLNGRHATNIRTDAVPLAIDFAKETSVLFASCSNLQINMYQQLPNKRFQFQGGIPTIDTQMSLAWMSTNEILYSGSESGVVNCWKPSDKSLLASMPTGHNDICMKLLALDQLDNLVSASMDTTIGVWDTYTNSIITKLKGHRKGVFDMSYNPDYRLLFSCGFDHDAFIWSPFVNSLVFKLKGHHASLVGCHSVENSPEVLTADEDGVFKLWDIRTFQCVQTFFHNSSMDSNEPAEHLSCFFHQNIPTSHRGDEGGEARIYAGSRRIRSFDQKRIVHQRTTDFTNVIWMSINCESFLIFTASDRNLIIWDLLLGSKMIM